MSNQTSQSENGASQLGHELAGEVASQVQSAAPKWGLVFHRFNSTAGDLFNTNINTTDSLGDVMERAKAQYQAFLPTSWLKRYISKVVIDQSTVDHPSTYDIGDQDFPVLVKVHTNIRHEQLTEAFYNPQNFRHVSVQNVEFAIFSSPALTRTVVSFRIVPNRKRLFWALALAMLAILLLAGIVAGVVSTSLGTSFLVIGALMGLLSLFVAVATVLWKN